MLPSAVVIYGQHLYDVAAFNVKIYYQFISKAEGLLLSTREQQYPGLA